MSDLKSGALLIGLKLCSLYRSLWAYMPQKSFRKILAVPFFIYLMGMNMEDPKQVNSSDIKNTKQSVNHSRRSFAKTSAMMLPVVTTLANRSAWAQANICGGSAASNLAFASFFAAGAIAFSSQTTAKSNPNWYTPAQLITLNKLTTAELTTYVYKLPGFGSLPVLETLQVQDALKQTNTLIAYQVASYYNTPTMPQLFAMPGGTATQLEYAKFYEYCTGLTGS